MNTQETDNKTNIPIPPSGANGTLQPQPPQMQHGAPQPPLLVQQWSEVSADTAPSTSGQMKKGYWILVMPIMAAVALNLSYLPSRLLQIGEDMLPLFLLAFPTLLASSIVVVVVHNSTAHCNPVRERQGMLIVKLGLLPFFIGSVPLARSGFVNLEFFFQSFIFIHLAYLVLIIGSVWAICYALSLSRAGVVSSGMAALFGLLEFVPVADVIAAIIMFVVGRNYEKQFGTVRVLVAESSDNGDSAHAG